MRTFAAAKVILEALLRALFAILFVGFIKRPTLCCTDSAADFRIDPLVIGSGVFVYAVLMTPVFVITVLVSKQMVADSAVRAFAGGALALLSIIVGLDFLQAEYWVEGETWMPLSYFTVAASGGAAGVLANWSMRWVRRASS